MVVADFEDVHAEGRVFFAFGMGAGVFRLRKNTLFDNGISLWVSGDQIWKSAVLNAIK
jgi:aspartate-semialdehyde dehydrogenase